MRSYLKARAKVALVLLLGFIFGLQPQASAETIFGANVRVEDPVSVTSSQYRPAVAVDTAGNIYITWSDYRNGNDDIYFAKSADNGATFGPHIRVDDTGSSTTWQVDSAIAVDAAGNIYIVWCDTRNNPWPDIYFARSTDGGATFEPNLRVDDGSIFSMQAEPSIAVAANGNIYVTWRDSRDGGINIYFAKSADGGVSFEANLRVDDSGSLVCDEINPPIAVSADGDIYIAWHDERNGNPDIYFAKSADSGASFGPDVCVNGDASASDQEHPVIVAAANGDIYVAWQDERDSYYPDIYFAKSTDGGVTFGSSILVDDDPLINDQLTPAIATDPNHNVYLTWHDDRSGNYDIYFAKSTDGGLSFENNIRVDDDPLTNNQLLPAIAADPNQNVYLAWYDERNSWADIYFSKGTETDIWILNMTEMNWYENVAGYFSTGAATAQMILNYIRVGAGEPTLTQNEIYEYARAPQAFGPDLTPDEIDKALGHYDPYDYLVSNPYDYYDSVPEGNPYQGYNFTVDTYDPGANPEAINEYMRDICHWMAYAVTQEAWWLEGALVARPNTPAAVPIFGASQGYNHWVAVKGCVTSEHPTPDPADPWNSPDFTVYGLWIKDPLVSGIGKNTYKTAAECASTYLQPVTTADAYDGLFVQVAEPPPRRSDAFVEIPEPTPDLANLEFIGADTATESDGSGGGGAGVEAMAATAELTENLYQTGYGWQGLVDEYLLTDAQAKVAFADTEMGEVLLVHRLDIEDADYHLVPFNKPVGAELLTSAVIILDAQEGYFKEASWTEEPERFLKVSKEEAFKRLRRYVWIPYFYLVKYAQAELVWQPGTFSASPYQPIWKISIWRRNWYVTQEGKVIPEYKFK